MFRAGAPGIKSNENNQHRQRPEVMLFEHGEIDFDLIHDSDPSPSIVWLASKRLASEEPVVMRRQASHVA
jgi:hypothetical protein